MPYQCPACGFPNLTEPPRSPKSGGASYEICYSCGFEFGYTDDLLEFTYESWRAKWISEGMKWSSKSVRSPDNWDPVAQLKLVDNQEGR